MADAKLTIKVGANVKDAARQLQALGYNIEDVKKSTDKANDSASLWQQTLKKGSEDNIKKLVELGAKYLTLTTIISGAAKGVKSLVSEGLKVNENASKQIESINTAWSDIKSNLGSALLDTVSPALDALLGKLEDIAEWSKTISGREDITKTFDKVQKGLGDWSSISTETLKTASDDLKKHIDELGISSHQKYQDMLDAITEEIKQREELGTADKNLEKATKSATTALSTLGSKFSYNSDDKLMNAWSFISSNSSYSSTYSDYSSKNDLELIKAEAINRKREIEKAIKTFSDSDWEKSFNNQLDYSNAVDLILESLEDIIKTIDDTLSGTQKKLSTASQNLSTKLSSLDNGGLPSAKSAFGLGGYSSDGLTSGLTLTTDAIFEYKQEQKKAAEETKIAWQDAFSVIASSASSVFSSLGDLIDQNYDKEIQAVEDSEASEEEKAVRIDQIKRKQFAADQANSLAQTAISVAEGLVDIWTTYASTPWLAGTLTALLAAQTGIQIATIKGQQYTGLAEGGIVQSPTHALIGEGAEKEAVMPLSKLEEYVNRDNSASGAIVINVSVNGNGKDTAEDVYYAIERAQRTGLLPKWRYA